MKTNTNVELKDDAMNFYYENYDKNNSVSKMGRTNSAPDNDYEKIYDIFTRELTSHIEETKKQMERFTK